MKFKTAEAIAQRVELNFEIEKNEERKLYNRSDIDKIMLKCD